MDAIEYLKAKLRMKRENCPTDNCSDCNIESFCKASNHENLEFCVAYVEQWAKDNPVKTYRDVVLEKFPNASLSVFYVENLFGTEHHGKHWVDEYINKN
ncbi:MAG: hypothetical protein WCO84_01090 [bacterium]